MLMGKTPFHSYEMKDLIQKINKGDYTVTLKEPISVEAALFLTQCLQANEDDRLNVEQLVDHPFFNVKANENGFIKLTSLDRVSY